MRPRRIAAVIVAGLSLGLGLGLVLAGSAAARPAAAPTPADPTRISDLEALAVRLKRHVAYLEVEVEPDPDTFGGDEERDGFALPLDARHLAVLAPTVDHARKITIHGPSGDPIVGQVVLYDLERRIAIVRGKQPLSRAGLFAPVLALKADRLEEEDIYTLVSTSRESGVVAGQLIDLGEQPELEGHLRINLKLKNGMPVFDALSRCIGYSRAVAWDPDQQLVITPELIQAARTATGAAARDARDRAERQQTHPWWAR